jgi:hypothetical protein
MAALPENDRLRVWRGVMRFWSNERETLSVTKAELRAAVDAADDWADANATSFNTALPAAFRNTATPGQKALLLAVVVIARYSPAFIRRALGVEAD